MLYKKIFSLLRNAKSVLLDRSVTRWLIQSLLPNICLSDRNKNRRNEKDLSSDSICMQTQCKLNKTFRSASELFWVCKWIKFGSEYIDGI